MDVMHFEKKVSNDDNYMGEKYAWVDAGFSLRGEHQPVIRPNFVKKTMKMKNIGPRWLRSSTLFLCRSTTVQTPFWNQNSVVIKLMYCLKTDQKESNKAGFTLSWTLEPDSKDFRP